MNSVVATLVAMVIFFTVFAARAPAMGNSADRAWQLSQLMEGVSTACNPNHGSLSCVQARRCVSKQIGRHDAACQGCPRCVVLAIQLFGSVFPPSNFSKEHQKERCGHFSAAALLHYFFMVHFGIFCCQQDFPPQFNDNTRTSVCQ